MREKREGREGDRDIGRRGMIEGEIEKEKGKTRIKAGVGDQ